jgi:hypothetical protein
MVTTRAKGLWICPFLPYLNGVRFDPPLLVSVLCSTFAYHTKSEERVVLTLIIFDLTSFLRVFISVNTFGQRQVIFLKIFVFDCKVLGS